MVDQAFVSDMRQRLVDEQESLQSELSRLRSIACPDDTQSEHAGMGNHMADDASDVFEQEKNLALMRNTSDILTKVEEALRRIDLGTYGMCQNCGSTIDHARLETIPYAKLCIPCKARQERA
jgi:DnaK suppressor protein